MRPCLLLTVDSLRADCVTHDLLGESLDVLEEDFAYFSNAISYGVSTPFAFPGIIAGSHPVGDGNIPEESTTLAEGLPGTSTAYTNNGHLRADRGYARGSDDFTEVPKLSEGSDPSAMSRIVDFLKQIDTLRESTVLRKAYNYVRSGSTSLPFPAFPAEDMADLVQRELQNNPSQFLWAHWMDPHTPYHPETSVGLSESLFNLDELGTINDQISSADADALSDQEIQVIRALYDANVRYYDKYFGGLLQWMQSQPWYDDAIIIVVSDHGEYFGEHGQLFHTWDIDPYDEAISTPLWVKYPEQQEAGNEFTHLVGHGDILATLSQIYKESSLKVPAHTSPLRRTEGRHIVSVSNTTKRLTESDGSLFIRRDGSREEQGTVSDEGQEFVESTEYPECKTSGGNTMGVEKAERQRQLAQLGYR